MTEDHQESEVVSLAERRARIEQAAARARAQQQSESEPGPVPTPYVTYALIAINALVWLVMVGLGVDYYEPSGEALLQWGGNLGLETTNGQWWRLLSAMFLHAGLIHLGFNLYFMWVVGRACEQIFSPLPYAVIYLCTGLLASLVSVAWQPAIVSVGASGALFGIFGAFVGFTIRRRASLPEAFVTSIRRNALILVGINIAIGIAVPGIDLAAHIGGLLAGLGMGYLLSKLAEKPVSDARAARALKIKATGVSAAVALAILVGGALALPRWDNPLPTLREAGARYDEVVDAFRVAGDDRAAQIEVLEEVAIPAMDEILTELAELDSMPALASDKVERWTRHYELRREAFAVELDGLRAGDPELIAKAEDLHADALAALE